MSKKQSTKTNKWEVILHDDDHNSFDGVVNYLMEICGHSFIQSVQCATLTHQAKKCSIYVDTIEMCEEVLDELIECGLTVTMKKYEKTK
jgi:ATP-dependent Clp protease adaptor protein ClpS